MSIINSLKTFSKKAFNVEPKGSNIDEVLDDMASKVTPGSGGGSGDGGVIFLRFHEDTFSATNPFTGEEMTATVLATDLTTREILAKAEDHLVMFKLDAKTVDPGFEGDNRVLSFVLEQCEENEDPTTGVIMQQLKFTNIDGLFGSYPTYNNGYDTPIMIPVE